MFAEFDHALGAGDHEIGDLGVAFRGFIEGGGKHRKVDGFLEVGDFFWAFVEEEDDELDVRVVGLDRFGDLFEQDGFTAARWSDDEAALASAEWSDEVDDANAKVFRAFAFEVDAGVWKHGCEFIEILRFHPFGGGDAFDFEDLGGGEVFVALDGLADFDFEELAVAEFGVVEDGAADVDVVLGRTERAMWIAYHREMFFSKFKHAHAGDVAAVHGVEADDFVDQLGFGDATLNFAWEVGGDFLEFGEGFEAELIEIDVFRNRVRHAFFARLGRGLLFSLCGWRFIHDSDGLLRCFGFRCFGSGFD